MWAADEHVVVLGSRFRVRVEPAPAASEVGRLLESFPTGRGPVPGRRNLAIVSGGAPDDVAYRLLVDERPVQRALSWPPLLAHLVAEINREAVDATSSFAVHAGVVAHRGEAVAFPGFSGAGKSTLTAACIRAGFDYVSDEALCVDYASGLVQPYPKPLALSQAAGRLLGLPSSGPVADERDEHRETLHTAAEFGATTATAPLALAHIVVTERRPGPAELAPLPAADAMAALLALSFNHYRRPVDAFRLASEAARRAQAWSLRLDHPAEAGRLLWDRLGGGGLGGGVREASDRPGRAAQQWKS